MEIKETECEKERPRGTQCNCIIKTQSYNKWRKEHYELGYKASYILIGLGQLPFDIFTKFS